MPILENPRHEAFARELAKGKSATEAYEAAGFKPARQNAHRLITKNDVSARLAELQAIGAEKAALSVESLIAEAEAVRMRAMELGQLSAAVAAIREKGILSGLRMEKSDRTISDKRSASDWTTAELVAFLNESSRH
jgi:phage terminase small subunit